MFVKDIKIIWWQQQPLKMLINGRYGFLCSKKYINTIFKFVIVEEFEVCEIGIHTN
jgi:hypothetical protein